MPSIKAIFSSLICAFAIAPSRVHAVVIYNNANGITSQPTGDQGWSVTGSIDTGGGVAIAPHWFLSAAHIGFSVGDTFNLNGVPYTTISATGIPNTDLTVVQVSGTFPSYAPLYSGAPGSEVNQTVAMVGFGHYQLDLSNPVTSTVASNVITNGWQWEGSTTGKSYATNVVVATGAFGTTSNLLDVQFNPTTANPAPGMYTYNDSGGGNFIYNNGAWQLAGLTYAIDAYYQSNGMGGYNYLDSYPGGVAIYNANGLYEDNGTPQNPDIEPATDIHENGYATEIAPYVSQIDAITGVPEPTAAGMAAVFAIGLLARRHRKGVIISANFPGK